MDVIASSGPSWASSWRYIWAWLGPEQNSSGSRYLLIDEGVEGRVIVHGAGFTLQVRDMWSLVSTILMVDSYTLFEFSSDNGGTSLPIRFFYSHLGYHVNISFEVADRTRANERCSSVEYIQYYFLDQMWYDWLNHPSSLLHAQGETEIWQETELERVFATHVSDIHHVVEQPRLTCKFLPTHLKALLSNRLSMRGGARWRRVGRRTLSKVMNGSSKFGFWSELMTTSTFKILVHIYSRETQRRF